MPPTSPGTRRSLTLALSRSTLSFDGLSFRGAWAPAASQAISGRRLYAALDKALSSGEFGQRSGSGSTTLSAASGQNGGRVSKPDRPHVIGHATSA